MQRASSARVSDLSMEDGHEVIKIMNLIILIEEPMSRRRWEPLVGAREGVKKLIDWHVGEWSCASGILTP